LQKPGSLLLFFLLCITALDWAVFRILPYQLPNESPWNTNHFFNFLYEWETIRWLPKTKPRVLILGSSIAYYSIDAKALERELRETHGLEVEVLYLAYAGNSPLYVYLLSHWLDRVKPDLVVYPLNFIDYRLHRTYVLFPEGKNETVEESVMVKDALTVSEAPQALWIFPWETLMENFQNMDWTDRSRFFWASCFQFYKVKDFFWTQFSLLYQHRFGRNTSYHAYAGYPIPETVNFLGWTGKTFSFPPLAEYERGKKGFWVEVPGFFLEQGEVSITWTQLGTEHQQTNIFQKPGWNQVFLDSEFFGSPELVQGELSRTWKAPEATDAYLDYHHDPMGVRLTQTFGLTEPLSGLQYTRPLRTEDLRYLNMGDKEYAEYFSYRLLEGLDKRPGIGYLVALERAKKRIAQENFRPFFHFRYLELLAESFRKQDRKLLLINNPENPLSLAWYENSPWYQGYLQYFLGLGGGSVTAVDWRSKLAPQNFSDFHHFTYPGMQRMNADYATQIRNLISK